MPHPHADYVPLSHTEQDVIHRMAENEDLYVEVVDWGYHPAPKITTGDKRMQIRFPMEFSKPVGITIPVYHFKLKLKMRDGTTVASTIESTVFNNQPLPVTAGMIIDLVWDLSFAQISDEIQRQILPGLRGKRVATIKNGKVVSDA